MKKLILLILVLVFYAGCNSNDPVSPAINNRQSDATEFNSLNIEFNGDTVITGTDALSLQFMREEEKLAGDVYKFYTRTFGGNVFSNISKSEDQHTSAIARLLVYFKLSDPVLTESKFSNPDLQQLYLKLTGADITDIKGAIKNGLLIEELDIKDLKERINLTSNQNIINVYQRLLQGSQNHLRAFYRQAIANNITYTPVFISQSEFDSIVK